jgi:hypothetical protein
MISSQMESLLLIVVGVFLVFSLFGSRRRVVLIYSLSSKELYLWWSMRLILMVLAFAVLYFVFPSIVTWAKTFILSLTQLIRSFVISLTAVI